MIETDDLDIFTLPDLEQYNVSIYIYIYCHRLRNLTRSMMYIIITT